MAEGGGEGEGGGPGEQRHVGRDETQFQQHFFKPSMQTLLGQVPTSTSLDW